MSRYSYDDMPPEGYREKRRGSGRMTAAIASIGVLLTLIAIIIYLLFTPHQENNESAVSVAESVTVNPVEPEIIESKAVIPVVAEDPEEEPEPIESRVSSAPSYEKASDKYQRIDFESHAVGEGETLLSIAEKYSLSSSTLVSVNKLSGAELSAGSILSIPPMDGTLCIVRSGDTLESIAAQYNPELSAADLAALNGKPYTAVYEGEEIFVPSPGTIENSSARMFSSPIPGGSVIARFGELVEGEAIEGVVIASSPGTAVSAAADGSVVNIFFHPRFGRSVTLLHENGYKTSYCGLETSNADTAQKVQQGDVIGTIGTSNEFFNEPAVVYCVEQYSVPLDPMNVTAF